MYKKGPLLQQKFEMADQCYSSVLFGKQRKIHPRGVRARQPKDVKRRESPGPLAPVFTCFFLPLGPALCKLG